jgi:tetratricopeptide (TPR) repeat protein
MRKEAIVLAGALSVACAGGSRRMPSSELMLTERMATVLLQQGNAMEAEGTYRRVLIQDPDNPEMRDGHGLSLLMLGRAKEAKDEFDRALKITPLPGYLNNRGAAKLELGELAGAEEDFLEAYKSPNLGDRESALINLGKARYRRALYAEAEEALTRALALNPASFEAFMNRGEAREALKNEPGAIEDYLSALRVRKDDLTAMLRVGLGLISLKQTELGRRYLRRVTEIAPETAEGARARVVLGEEPSSPAPPS